MDGFWFGHRISSKRLAGLIGEMSSDGPLYTMKWYEIYWGPFRWSDFDVYLWIVLAKNLIAICKVKYLQLVIGRESKYTCDILIVWVLLANPPKLSFQNDFLKWKFESELNMQIRLKFFLKFSGGKKLKQLSLQIKKLICIFHLFALVALAVPWRDSSVYANWDLWKICWSIVDFTAEWWSVLWD